jgi:CheY-like chemotaxis protein
MSMNTTSGEGLTILVVDDDRRTTDVVSESIDRDQLFKLVEVENAEEAVEVLTHPYNWQIPVPDLVLINPELYAAHAPIIKTALMRANIPQMRTALVGVSALSDSYSLHMLPTPIKKKDVVTLIDQLYRDIAQTGSSKGNAQVFLSHSSGDKERVRALYQRLSSDGVQCWFDEENLLGGQDWDYEISRAIQESKIFLACLSNHSVNKAGYVQAELKKALDVADKQPEGAVFILPVRLEDCVLPRRLSRWHRIDLFLDGGYERLLKSVRAALQGRS